MLWLIPQRTIGSLAFKKVCFQTFCLLREKMPRILFLVIREDLNMEEPSIPTDVKRHQRRNEKILFFLKTTGLVEHVVSISWGFRNAVCTKNYFRFLGFSSSEWVCSLRLHSFESATMYSVEEWRFLFSIYLSPDHENKVSHQHMTLCLWEFLTFRLTAVNVWDFQSVCRSMNVFYREGIK